MKPNKHFALLLASLVATTLALPAAEKLSPQSSALTPHSSALSPQSSALSTNSPCCTESLKPTTPLPDASLYQIDSTWLTDKADSIKLSGFAGRPHVITMFFSNCTYACPILANDMKKIEAALPAELRSSINFSLVSFDSDRDTPEALAKFRKSRAIPESWTLLTSKPDDILELAMLLGIKFKKEPSSQFSHSNVITVLDSKGQIVFQQNGLNNDPAEIASTLKRLLAAN
jgi:protein SCO1